MSKLVVIGMEHAEVAKILAHSFAADHIAFTLGKFADEEVFFSLSNQKNIASTHILLIHQFCWKAHKSDGCLGSINDQISGLLELIDCIKALGAQKISLLLPYLPYSRQDKSDYVPYQGGVYTLGKCLKVLGVDQVLSCDLHSCGITKDFPVDLISLSLADFWKELLQKKLLVDAKNVCIATPDSGGSQRAQAIANALDLPCIVIEKKRVAIDQACAQSLNGDVAGKTIVIIDDIIDTGRTAASAARLLKEHGATKIFGCFSHGIFSAGAQDRLQASGIEKIFVTDTLDLALDHHNDFCHVVSIASFITTQMGTLFS